MDVGVFNHFFVPCLSGCTTCHGIAPGNFPIKPWPSWRSHFSS
ncbi:hypothetical protein O23A_p2347 [Aeromonas salmonicida]|nr:hypothetical protein O23A_p2347 [Aeromonas salmonicida]